jgi:sulfur relay (sulfurtransferase) DsrF/TusC family protein
LTEFGKDGVWAALFPLLVGASVEKRLLAARLLLERGINEQLVLEALIPLLQEADLGLKLAVSRILAEFGIEGEKVVEALSPILYSAEDNFIVEASEILLKLRKMEYEALECLVRLIEEANLWRSLASIQKVISGDPLTEEDGHILDDLVSVRSSDREEQQLAKGIVFEWLFEVLVMPESLRIPLKGER